MECFGWFPVPTRNVTARAASKVTIIQKISSLLGEYFGKFSVHTGKIAARAAAVIQNSKKSSLKIKLIISDTIIMSKVRCVSRRNII